MTLDRSEEQYAAMLGRWAAFSVEELCTLLVHLSDADADEYVRPLFREIGRAIRVHAELEGGTDPVGAL